MISYSGSYFLTLFIGRPTLFLAGSLDLAVAKLPRSLLPIHIIVSLSFFGDFSSDFFTRYAPGLSLVDSTIVAVATSLSSSMFVSLTAMVTGSNLPYVTVPRGAGR